MDFYWQNLVKGNTYTWGHFRTTGVVWSQQCMQGVTKLGPSMHCSTKSKPKSAKSTNKSSSIFSTQSKTVSLNPQQIDPNRPSYEMIFSNFITAFWLLHIQNNNSLVFQHYFWQILSFLNSYWLSYWTCAKFPAQGVTVQISHWTVFLLSFQQQQQLVWQQPL